MGPGTEQYPVIYDAELGLRYIFDGSSVGIPTGGGGSTPNIATVILRAPTSNASDTTAPIAGLTTSFTASSNTSQVRLDLSSVLNQSAVAAGDFIQLYFYKDGSSLTGTNGLTFIQWPTTGNVVHLNMEFYDTPGDTSPHTYEVWGRSGAGNSFDLGLSDLPVVFSVTEIH